MNPAMTKSDSRFCGSLSRITKCRTLGVSLGQQTEIACDAGGKRHRRHSSDYERRVTRVRLLIFTIDQLITGVPSCLHSSLRLSFKLLRRKRLSGKLLRATAVFGSISRRNRRAVPLRRIARSRFPTPFENPSRRNTGSGGHHPWTACWSKNAPTTAGKANHRRSTVAPSVTPINEAVAAFASSVRSTSHSASSSSRRRAIAAGPARFNFSMFCSVWRRIRSFTAWPVWFGTRSTVVGSILLSFRKDVVCESPGTNHLQTMCQLFAAANRSSTACPKCRAAQSTVGGP